MRTLLKGGKVYTEQGFAEKDLLIEDNRIQIWEPAHDCGISDEVIDEIDRIVVVKNKYIIPGFADVHVHLREPGFSYKETIKRGTLAAAAGGYTTVCPMPNVNPAPATMKQLEEQLKIIRKDAVVKTIPYGTITSRGDGRSTLSEMEEMAPCVVGFSDDGKGVQTGDLMEAAMERAKTLDMPIVAHCEDESLLTGGYIHEGSYCERQGHKGISSASEWKQVERDVNLAAKTGCKYHVCHVSTKESVEIIRQAKASGVNVTCETGPHYLILTDEDLQEDGCFKMNPPLRSIEDKEALIAGVQDGTIDIIATDHAPHAYNEKCRGLGKSAFGIVGLETCFALLNTYLVNKGIITFEKLIECMSVNPRKRFELGDALGFTKDWRDADATILDREIEWKIDSKEFFSKGNATPFDQWNVVGRPIMTIVDGKIVFSFIQ